MLSPACNWRMLHVGPEVLYLPIASVKMKFMKNDVDRMDPELLRVLEGKKRKLDRHRPPRGGQDREPLDDDE